MLRIDKVLQTYLEFEKKFSQQDHTVISLLQKVIQYLARVFDDIQWALLHLSKVDD